VASCTQSPGVSGLAKWRLKRAIDYIQEHLAEPIGLAQMAASAGLSRMHFAAQFRLATGMRPHEYLLRRRTERAQNLLSASTLPLVEVALEVGFKSQSHFTTVFTGLVGKTPKNWRQQTLAAQSVGHAAIGRCQTPSVRSDCAPHPRTGRRLEFGEPAGRGRGAEVRTAGHHRQRSSAAAGWDGPGR
jgi:AraC-like DNA-binding protein